MLYSFATFSIGAASMPYESHEWSQHRKTQKLMGMDGNVPGGKKTSMKGMAIKVGMSAKGKKGKEKHWPTPSTSPSLAEQVRDPASPNCDPQVIVECIPPMNPQDINGEKFKDCDSMHIDPSECLEVPCIFPVSFNILIQNTNFAFSAEVVTLSTITNFDPPNDILNFTSEASGKTIEPGETLSFSSGSIDIDLTLPKRYTLFTSVGQLSPDGYYCSASDYLTFTLGNVYDSPSLAPIVRPSIPPPYTPVVGPSAVSPLAPNVEPSTRTF